MILPGGFDVNPDILPQTSKYNGQSYNSGAWLTMGGDGVGSPTNTGHCLDITWLESKHSQLAARGLCFDMEGCLNHPASQDLIGQLVQKLKNEKPFHTIFTPKGDLASQHIPTYEDMKEAFDFAAPMFYWGDTTYRNVNCNMVKGWLQNWLNKGWPKEKLFVTYQGTSAAQDTNGPAVLLCLAQEAKTGYRGLLGWPSLTLADNTNNMDVILKETTSVFYQRCFDNAGGSQYLSNVGLKTLPECANLARQKGLLYFGLEAPSGGKAKCVLVTSFTRQNQKNNADCQAATWEGHPLGGNQRLAFYTTVQVPATVGEMSYKGCYINDGSKRINSLLVGHTLLECLTLAWARGDLYFGLEYPQGWYNDGSGRAQCFLHAEMPNFDPAGASDCQARTWQGKDLGSGYRQAIYCTGLCGKALL